MDREVKLVLKAIASLEDKNMAEVLKVALLEYCQRHTYTAIWEKAVGEEVQDGQK